MVLVLWSGNIGYVSWKKLLFIVVKKTAKSPTKNYVGETVPAAKVINRVSNFWPDRK